MAAVYTDANFDAEVIKAEKLTVVDFWAPWCGPCLALGPTIEALAKEYDGKVNIGKVNVDENPQLSINYGITSIPAVLERIEAKYAPAALAIDRTDGISLEFADWRFNLRGSNTEPVLRLNVESRGDEALMQAKTAELLALIESAP